MYGLTSSIAFKSKSSASQIYVWNLFAGGVVHGEDSVKAMQVLGKRPAEEIGVVCKMKKQALELSAGSPRMSNLKGTAALSQNSSLSMEKRKATHGISEIPRFPNTSRIQVSKSNFSTFWSI